MVRAFTAELRASSSSLSLYSVLFGLQLDFDAAFGVLFSASSLKALLLCLWCIGSDHVAEFDNDRFCAKALKAKAKLVTPDTNDAIAMTMPTFIEMR